jgi:hypothetical protein
MLNKFNTIGHGSTRRWHLCHFVQDGTSIPLDFFTSMVQLVVHLVCECRLGGPVQYRWMYLAER